ncbi:ABC transporter ATP-binding protein [Nocardia iowensis]|uniref:ABC transporter ATP-binding protein n=1 Tax=Nocardia iowensis TaxID=204891 RepID=A0ABX8RVS3_NOCIO|nr:ABC transporter ATP-binding protein [Nocardia iowensis]QXN93087.1 ABC transporter ATP-binding protein [Nocardia iowensis]
MIVPALEVQDVSLHFGAVAALSEVSFAVAPGEVFAIIGPNGAGKSSLFNVLSRLYPPSSGRIRVDGRDIRDLRPHQLPGLGVARTFQNLGLFGPLSVLDNVLIGRSHAMTAGCWRTGLRTSRARTEERAARDAAHALLHEFDLHPVAEQPVGTLPYGIRKRVEIARALLMRPSLLLLDEPVAGMSRLERSEVADLITEIHQHRQLTVVLVEHDMSFVMRLAQHVLVLDFGKSIACGTPDSVQSDPRVLAAYLGTPDLDGESS